MKYALSIILASGVLLGAGCVDRASPTRTSTPTSTMPTTTVTTSRQMSPEETRDQYIVEVHANLNELKTNIQALKDKTEDMGTNMKVAYAEAIQKLEQERDDAETKLDELRRASLDTWVTLKTSLDAAVAGTKQSYLNLKARIDASM